jgi:hypothetical protein
VGEAQPEAAEPPASPASVTAVDALFARLKEERSTPAEPPGADDGAAPAEVEAGAVAGEAAQADTTVDLVAAEPDGGPAGTDAPAPEPAPVSAEHGPRRTRAEPAPAGGPELAARDAATAKVRAALARRAKRALQDEQNELLDALRKHKGRPSAHVVLADVDARIDAWADVLAPAVDEVYRAAARAVAPSATLGGVERGLLVELATSVSAPLQERLASAFEQTEPSEGEDDEDDSEDVTQRLGARYREWRTQRLDDVLADVLAAAWARGALDAAPEGARLRWITPTDGCCPDCDDDALEPTTRGEAFPTGQLAPPAHPGCRCVLAVEAVEPAASTPS